MYSEIFIKHKYALEQSSGKSGTDNPAYLSNKWLLIQPEEREKCINALQMFNEQLNTRMAEYTVCVRDHHEKILYPKMHCS